MNSSSPSPVIVAGCSGSFAFLLEKETIPLPLGKKPFFVTCASNRAPILRSAGNSACRRNSIGGEKATFVPPSTRSFTGCSIATGSTCCSRRDTAPAVAIFTLKLTRFISRGENSIAIERGHAPSSAALHISAIVFIEARCCGFSPGISLPALIFDIFTGFFVSAESASAVRRSCPPPSPIDPSISTNSGIVCPHILI